MTTTPTPKVTPLVWKHFPPSPTCSNDAYVAKAPLFGRFCIDEYGGRINAYWDTPGYINSLIPDSFPTLEAAKAAVQAEYDKAILACLEPLVEEAEVAEHKDNWVDIQKGDLDAAIVEFTTALPGWWFTVGACHLSRDASCGPDRKGQHAYLLERKKFDEGFHADLREGTIAEALRDVTEQALEALALVDAEQSATPPVEGS